jgi:hypothetical protein
MKIIDAVGNVLKLLINQSAADLLVCHHRKLLQRFPGCLSVDYISLWRYPAIHCYPRSSRRVRSERLFQVGGFEFKLKVSSGTIQTLLTESIRTKLRSTKGVSEYETALRAGIFPLAISLAHLMTLFQRTREVAR